MTQHTAFIQALEILTGDCFVDDMTFKLATDSKFSQGEAQRMAAMLNDIYMMTHALIGRCANQHEDWKQKTEAFISHYSPKV